MSHTSSTALWHLALTRHTLTQIRLSHQEYNSALSSLATKIAQFRQTEGVLRALEADADLHGLESRAALYNLEKLLDAQDRMEAVIVVLEVRIREVEGELRGLLGTRGLAPAEVGAVVSGSFDARPFWSLKERLVEKMVRLLAARGEHLRILARLGEVYFRGGGLRRAERDVCLRRLVGELRVAGAAVRRGVRSVRGWRIWVERLLEDAVLVV